MAKDVRDLLTVLRNELQFLEQGGYRHTARAAWRPHFIFQDSPTCLNFDPAAEPRPCSDCVLMQLVPEVPQGKRFPCRYIPLNDRGETIDSFYRSGTEEELEKNFGQWLRSTIERLEKESNESGTKEPVADRVKTKATQSNDCG